MTEKTFLDNFDRLHHSELCLRREALEIMQNNLSLRLHLDVAERTMTLAKMIYSSPVEDEDYKVIRMLTDLSVTFRTLSLLTLKPAKCILLRCLNWPTTLNYLIS